MFYIIIDNFQSTSWTISEGSEGATCRLLCVDEDNLDVTATCSWNGKIRLKIMNMNDTDPRERNGVVPTKQTG